MQKKEHFFKLKNTLLSISDVIIRNLIPIEIIQVQSIEDSKIGDVFFMSLIQNFIHISFNVLK